jgi:inosine-uridine nucleoside N-ribohydrolase
MDSVTSRRKIIMDTDPGVDDAMAIFLALRSPELEVIGLTTIFGNVHTDLATTNALRLLEIASRADIPVAPGAQTPLARAYGGPVPFIHGEDGQGNVHLPPPTGRALEITAAEFIIEQVMCSPGEITLVPIGPLTNIALALQLEPRIAQNVKEIVLMGGNAFCQGNATPAAEANIHNDPEAADLVFGAPWRVTMVGLDVTHEVVMTRADMARLEASNNPLSRHLARITPLYQNFVEYYRDLEGYYIHDPTAVAYLIDPDALEVRDYPVRVETQGISAGNTCVNTNSRYVHPDWRDRPSVGIAVSVNAERVLNLILERLGNA